MQKEHFQLRDAVPANFYGTVVVDTSCTFEGYYETMVFKTDPMTGITCASSELDVMQYATEEQATAGHYKMIEKWRKTNYVKL